MCASLYMCAATFQSFKGWIDALTSEVTPPKREVNCRIGECVCLIGPFALSRMAIYRPRSRTSTHMRSQLGGGMNRSASCRWSLKFEELEESKAE